MHYLELLNDTVKLLNKYNMKFKQLSGITESRLLKVLRDLVTKITNDEYSYNIEQIKQIVLGIEQNLAVSLYASTEYNSYQMEEMRLGLLHNIEITSYADPKNSWVYMRERRLKLQYELTLKNKKCDMNYLDTMNFKDALKHTKCLLEDKTLSFDDRGDITESFAQCYPYFDTSKFDKYFLAD